MQKITFTIAGMDCAAEEALIKNKLSSIQGVESLEFNLIQEQLTVKHTLTGNDLIIKALKEIGLPPKHIDGCCGSEVKKEILLKSSNTNKTWLLLTISAILALISEILSLMWAKENTLIVISLSVISMLISGRETFIKGIRAIQTFTLNINFLMVLAVTGAILIGEWPEAAMVTVLFAIAEMIEKYSLDKARNAIRGLMEMTPDIATVKNTEGNWEKKAVSEVKVDSVLWVKPGERIPLDGIIVSGSSNINQAPITGESMPVIKKLGDQVFAGSINEQGSFEFKVMAQANDTTLARIIRAIQQAQSERAPTERFVDQFSKYYTPIMVILAVLIAIVPPLVLGSAFYPWLYKALILLVIACPCALVISTPITVVSGLAAAAKQGILVKGGAYLEIGRKLKVIALDKTGTITEGKPTVTNIISLNGMADILLLKLAASLDIHSDHPIARAIVGEWNKKWKESELQQVSGFESITGRGAMGVIGGQRYFIGNHRLIEEKGICNPTVEQEIDRLEQEGKTTLILSNEKEPLAVFAVADTLRQTSINAIKELTSLGIISIMMTGDNATTANAIAKNVGITDVRANLLPEDKLAGINSLLEKYHFVGMVGDGINDAPALAKASIGFAMGAAGTDTALETADVALMEDNLNKLPYFIKLSKKTSSILIQNISLSITVKMIFFILALLGKATLWMAVFADMGTSLIVVLNGLRLIRSR